MKKSLDAVTGLVSNFFEDMVKLEETFLKQTKFKDISSKEIRTIDAIGSGIQKSMGSIAKKLDITVGTLTVSITNLEKKGYVRREKSIKDKRIVNVNLTEKGKKAFNLHRDFKEEVMENAVITLTNQEKEIFSGVLNRVSEVLKKQCSNILS